MANAPSSGQGFSRSFTVIGDRELEGKLLSLQRRVVNDGARKAVRAGSTPMLQGMRNAIPKGPSGNLRRSLKRKINRNQKMAGSPYTANIFVAAPHAHLVRFGTKGPRKSNKGMSNLNSPGKLKGYAPGPKYFALRKKAGRRATFFGKEVKPMPANAFVQRVYEQHRQEFVRQCETVLRQVMSSGGTA